MIITDPDLALTFGEVDLLGHDRTGPFWFDTIAEGTEWGNAEQLVRAIETFLQDGTIQVVDGYGNREMPLELKITGEDSAGLAQGELALFSEVGKRNTLTWTPPDVTGAGEPCVFDVVSSRLDHALDDLGELRLERRYKLTVAALPFARSETISSATSPAPSSSAPTITTVDACNAATGWSVGTVGSGAVATDGASVFDTVGSTTFTDTQGYLALQKTFSAISMTATPLLRIDWSLTKTGPVVFGTAAEVLINEQIVQPVAANGSVRYYLCPSSTLTSVRMYQWVSSSGFHGVATLRIRDISRTNSSTGDLTGARQNYATFAIAGSARTQVSLALEDPTTALGSVLVYTTPNAAAISQPPLRVRRVDAGASTADASLVSGASSDLSSLHAFSFPVDTIPTGAYLLMARVKHATAGARTITYAGRSRMGTPVLDTGQTGTRTVTLAANIWAVVPVALLTLPTVKMGPDGLVRIELSGPAGLLLDEGWLFNVSDGRLTVVEAGTAAPTPGGPGSNRLFIDAPSVDSAVPAVWLGNSADRSDAFGAGSLMESFGDHQFTPPSMNVFVVTTNSVACAVTISYWPRYHTHVVGP